MAVQETKEKIIEFELLTPERLVFKQAVSFVVLPGVLGELGILPGHAPLMTALIWGELRIKDSQEGIKRFAVTGGFAQVQSRHVVVLADAAEPS